jgi:hypothetical protein
MQPLVKIALKLSHSLVQYFPSNERLFSLTQDLGKPSDIFSHLDSYELNRLNSKPESALYFANSSK